MTNQKPFGSYSLAPAREFFRKIAHKLPATYFGRRAASLLLGPSGGRSKSPKDVIIFGNQKARLHPYDNICEKRVFATPQLWDAQERHALRSAARGNLGEPFYFLDVGANAGLYSLFMRSCCPDGCLKAACIEPDPEMRARLAYNIEANAAEKEIRLFPYAVTDERQSMSFHVNETSHGLSKLDETGSLMVQGAPLLEIIQTETSFPRIDAMKIDIEGFEYPALSSFFSTSPKTLFPRMIILETSHEADKKSAFDLCLKAGYLPTLQTKMNAVLILHNDL